MDIFFIAVCLLLVLFLLKQLDRYVRSLKLKDLHTRYVLITGCDSGFGNLLAHNLDRIGVPVFASCLLQKSAADLHEKCSSRLKAFLLDVTCDDDIQKAVAFVRDNMKTGGSMFILLYLEFHFIIHLIFLKVYPSLYNSVSFD